MLSRRIEKLDAEQRLGLKWPRDGLSTAERHATSQLMHFVNVMSWQMDTLYEIDVGPLATITPERADELVSRSRLLAEIKQTDSSLVTGPIDMARQHWTPSGRPAYNCEPPNKQRFSVLQVDQPVAVKPFGVGLCTSTASAAGVSMWRALLGPGGSMMHPLPRYTWELEIDKDATVAEIVSAANWVEFVCTHARLSDGFVFPDWIDIAQSFDAVHITLPAIVAAQGLSFATRHGAIPAAFWDVETTFWLRWCFSGAHLVEGASVMPSGGRP